MKTYRVPKRFIEDHADRVCLVNADGEGLNVADVLAKETKAHYFVNLTDAQANELMSDADYYATGSDQEDLGLRSSARATVKALYAAGIALVTPVRWVY